jgi:hypothetical protein
VWHGTSGHFVAAERCFFRLHTTVGRWRVSTVGEYYPPDNGDKPEEVGAGRLYETMVFRLVHGEVCDWNGVEMAPYNTRAAAEAGHVAACKRWEGKQ